MQTHLERIKSAVTTSDGIIESMADLTRVTDFKMERIGLIEVLIDSIKAVGPPETIEIIETYSEEEIEIDGDSDTLGRAFRNIIVNAVHSMESEGTLSITVKRPDEREVAVSFADTCPGIPNEILKDIFKPLFTTRAKGMGLGLSITGMDHKEAPWDDRSGIRERGRCRIYGASPRPYDLSQARESR